MSKLRFQQVVIAVLLVTNIGLLLFGFVFRRPPHDPDGPKRIVIERLQFDKGQIREYERYIAWHRAHIRERNATIRRLKAQLYTYLRAGSNHAPVNALTSRIGREQQEIEAIHFRHFLQIRSLCRQDQLPAFNALSREILEVFDKRPPRP